jgi:hypothetical protein
MNAPGACSPSSRRSRRRFTSSSFRMTTSASSSATFGECFQRTAFREGDRVVEITLPAFLRALHPPPGRAKVVCLSAQQRRGGSGALRHHTVNGRLGATFQCRCPSLAGRSGLLKPPAATSPARNGQPRAGRLLSVMAEQRRDHAMARRRAIASR